MQYPALFILKQKLTKPVIGQKFKMLAPIYAKIYIGPLPTYISQVSMPLTYACLVIKDKNDISHNVPNLMNEFSISSFIKKEGSNL